MAGSSLSSNSFICNGRGRHRAVHKSIESVQGSFGVTSHKGAS